jgi:hypothetical protein
VSAILSYIYLGPTEWVDLLNAASHFLEVLVSIFGRQITGLILLFLFIFSIAYKRYKIHQNEKSHRAVIEEKERTIQRLAEENRNYRVVILKSVAGWTDDEVDRFVMKDEFKDGVAARKALEGEDVKEDSKQLDQAAQRSNERRKRAGSKKK